MSDFPGKCRFLIYQARDGAIKLNREVSFTSHFYKPQRLLCWNVRWGLPEESPQGGGAAYGKQIFVTVSRDLTVNHGRYFKRKLGALREGVPA